MFSDQFSDFVEPIVLWIKISRMRESTERTGGEDYEITIVTHHDQCIEIISLFLNSSKAKSASWLSRSKGYFSFAVSRDNRALIKMRHIFYLLQWQLLKREKRDLFLPSHAFKAVQSCPMIFFFEFFLMFARCFDDSNRDIKKLLDCLVFIQFWRLIMIGDFSTMSFSKSRKSFGKRKQFVDIKHQISS